ncbi:type II toxin-antitoxin system HipA family toxin [Azospirillum brasilense]|uniref:Type II toxin-antitoxin system HipA family toxin n=1 Tax=Azospirillum brasilense TaxID=192 RepID=A0A6L3ARU7_AZOBR|nr:HipA domain-containing protein [Azospirillum brasilense]KAA0676753.1 type II toxin-antitoxin system HipA family toxin [Azospirillum brasilense]
MADLTLQIHHGGQWHTAAALVVKAPEKGIASSCTLDYDTDYFVEIAAEGGLGNGETRDWRALSVRVPLDMTFRSLARWPAFLLDLLPQGHARRRLTAKLGFTDPDAPGADLPLLLQGAGNPIGNLRILEAAEAEREAVAADEADVGPCPGVTMDDILGRSDLFLRVAERFALAASGSSGVQGEWPKILMTQATDGLWYPDSLVPDEHARSHVIVKMIRGRHPEDRLILASEAPYYEVAREFGLRTGAPLDYGRHVLVIPRFDRAIRPDGIVRLGQESLVSAIGVAEFGHVSTHEAYLAEIVRNSADPAADVTEYVLRDLLNVAMGNPDNHGRNSALQKLSDRTVRLAPLFDFAPMRLDPSVIRRSTRWACMGGRDAAPDWSVICEAAAEGVMAVEDLMAAVAGKEAFLRDLPAIAHRHGVPEEAVETACRRHREMADSVAALKDRGHVP